MHGGGWYRITVRGKVTDRLATAFDGMQVETGVGRTVLVGRLQDQAALYGLLNRLRDFGLELIELEKVKQ
jgi:hypothetical protein